MVAVGRVWTAPLLLGVLLGASSGQVSLPQGVSPWTLEEGFLRPPDSAKPHTWWHWCNDNISQEGITADLEAMKRVGIGGVQIFNVDVGVPAGPVKFMSEAWRAMIRHALREAERLGLEVCVHNCAGWSSSGGPWVRPEHAMQMVVMSEVRVSGPASLDEVLPQPETRRDFYRDIAVLAFRTPEGERRKMAEFAPQITASVEKFKGSVLVDGDLATFAVLPLPKPGQMAYLQLEFPQPFQARSFLLVPGPGNNEHQCALQASEDGKNFRTLRTFSIPRPGPTPLKVSVNFDPVSARFYRLAFLRPSPRAQRITVAEVELRSGLRIENIGGKAAYVRVDNLQPALGPPAPADALIPRESIIDLTGRLQPDGRLSWEVPEGEWTILRIGHTPTGKDNHPATPEGRGLEVDKLSREALEAFWSGMMATVLAEAGPLAGKVLNNALIDSYEVGCQNWTPRFREEFRRRRGYDLLPFLPVLAGYVVGSVELSERFLWDFRRTIADLFAENYYGFFAELCHRHGLLFSTEPYGNGPFEDLTCGGRADIPMGEFWVGGGTSSSCKLAASAAHIYGRRIVGAESFTATPERGRWQNDPYALKALGDLIYCLGVNRFIFHRYAHQPWQGVYPGMTMGPWGFHFERTNTWFEQSRAWLEYLARCQYLLQQGRFVADVCFFVGEHAPNSAPFLPSLKAQGYDYDACNAEVLLTRMRVKDGFLVLPDGMRYRVLVLPESPFMTPQVLRKIRELVLSGATVIGPKPQRSPSLSDYPRCDEEVRRLAEEVWGDCDGKRVTERALGAGRVVWGKTVEEVLAGMGVPPDFEFEPKEARLEFIHRVVGNADIYFVSNQRDQVEEVECHFRVSGKAPELWHPDTGRIEPAPVWTELGGRTVVPLRLEPAGSVFVVFRQPLRGEDHLVAVVPPVSKEPQPSGPRLEIVRAIYEAVDGAGAADVTERVRSLVKGGRLAINVNNQTMGGDPTPLHYKRLRLEYTLDGKPFTLVVNENENLEVPLPEGTSEVPPFRVALTPKGQVELRAFRPGVYEFRSARGRRARVPIAALPEPLELGGPWEIRFPAGWGAPEQATFPRLLSWTEHENPGIRYFSGTATYLKEFEVPASWLGRGRRVYLDLGRVKNLAQVRLNGRDLGILWKMPFRVEVTDLLRAGRNRLEVRVTNLWVNRLIGDEQFPDDCEWEGRRLRQFPQWFLEGRPRPSAQRLTFTTWKHWDKNSPLLESGLLGPVRLLMAAERVVTLW